LVIVDGRVPDAQVADIEMPPPTPFGLVLFLTVTSFKLKLALITQMPPPELLHGSEFEKMTVPFAMVTPLMLTPIFVFEIPKIRKLPLLLSRSMLNARAPGPIIFTLWKISNVLERLITLGSGRLNEMKSVPAKKFAS
jgi:hypothetical protein